MKVPRAGFTLIELLLASVIAALLIGGMALMLGGLGRDRARLQSRNAVGQADQMLEMIRWDLANASKMFARANVLTLEGYGGIDRGRMVGTNRAARVVYRVRRDGVRSALVREQRFLDAPVHAQPWTEIVANGATRLMVTSNVTPEPDVVVDAEETDDATTMSAATTSPASSTISASAPALVRVRVEFTDHVIDQDLRIR